MLSSSRQSKTLMFRNKILEGTIEDTNTLQVDYGLKNVELYEHQKKAVCAMMKLEQKENIEIKDNVFAETTYGILCDKVGAGKSIMILALLSAKPVCENFLDTRVLDYRYIYNVGFRMIRRDKHDYMKTNLIVVPTVLFLQWTEYIEKFTNLSLFKIKKKVDLCTYFEDQTIYNIVLVCNKMYKDFATKANEKSQTFTRVIFDEVDTIEIPNTTRITGSFYWFISASVTNLVVGHKRNLGFLHDVLQMNRGVNNEFIYIKNNDNQVDLSMNLPKAIINIIKCKSDRILSIIGNVIPTRIQMMISGGDVQMAMEELNIFNDTSENIVKIVTESLNRQLQNAKMRFSMSQNMYFSSEEEKNKELTDIKKSIKEFEHKIKLVQERIDAEDVDPISFEPIEQPIITKCCQNKFDAKSILSYIQYNSSNVSSTFCPMCKNKPFTTESILQISSRKKDVKKNITSSWDSIDHSKIDNLIHLYENGDIQKDERVLIMTEFNDAGFLNQLYDMLEHKKIEWANIRSKGHQEHTSIEKYKKGVIKCLLLNARHYGAGLNLEMTDHVIFLHKMTAELETQVIGRAQRIGRTNTLRVWKLFDSYEYE